MRVSLFFFLLFILNSCNILKYSAKDSFFYSEFGDKSDYVSLPSSNIGVSLLHGFDFYNISNKLKFNHVPHSVKKDLLFRKGDIYFILNLKWSGSLNVVKQNVEYKKDLISICKQKNVQNIIFDSIGKTILYELISPDLIYCANKYIIIDNICFSISSYTFIQKNKKNRDYPSLINAFSDCNEIINGFNSPEYFKDLTDSNKYLFSTCSKLFWHSKNNYLLPLDYLHKSNKNVLDTTQFYEASSTFNSFIGNYALACNQRDILDGKPILNKILDTTMELLDAESVIYDSAKVHQILILNEAHTQPLNRLFLSKIIDSLFKFGYKTIFMETLTYEDSLLNTRRYPLQASGYYCAEPNFGNAIRKALKIGYNLLPYDNELWDYDREFGQARVISNFLNKNPNEKILIYCGHGHIDESKNDSMMAYFLKNLTKINPFTIEQTKYIQKGSIEFENDRFKFFESKKNFTKCQTFVKNNKLWKPNSLNESFDMLIITPRINFDTLDRFNNNMKKYNIFLNGQKFKDCILQIFSSEESSKASYWNLVPVYNKVLMKYNDCELSLEPGTYEAIVTSVNRKIIYKKTIKL